MRPSRSKLVLDALIAANGAALTGEQLAERTGVARDLVASAISEARDWFDAPIETLKPRGSGWRLPANWRPASTEDAYAKPGGRPAAPATRQAMPLSRQGEIMLAALEAAAGAFVDGKTLADPLGLYPSELGRVARHIMNKRPGITIQGMRGRGYRLAVDGVLELPSPPAAPPAALPKHVAHRTAIELLKELHPAVAEKVRGVALEAGESATDTIHRLLEYGIEVHHDLVANGQHPLQLRRAA